MKDILNKFNSPVGILIFGVVLLITINLISEFKQYSNSIKKASSSHESNSDKFAEKNEISDSVDTYIPKDHVLIPIEIENISAIDALIGNFSLADLYKTSVSNESSSAESGILIASHVKLLRAPLDPKEFAVLIHKTKAKWLMKIGTKYRVVIQNYKNAETSALEPEFYDQADVSSVDLINTKVQKTVDIKSDLNEKSQGSPQLQVRKKSNSFKVNYQYN